jgi:hypothetical protein
LAQNLATRFHSPAKSRIFSQTEQGANKTKLFWLPLKMPVVKQFSKSKKCHVIIIREMISIKVDICDNKWGAGRREYRKAQPKHVYTFLVRKNFIFLPSP